MTTLPRKRDGRQATQELGLKVEAALYDALPANVRLGRTRPGSVKKAPRIRESKATKSKRRPWYETQNVRKVLKGLHDAGH
jgi:hypothetical protein